MDDARAALVRAWTAGSSDTDRVRAVRGLLTRVGAASLGLPTGSPPLLDELIRRAADAPPGDERRSFAVLLVDALRYPGVMPARGPAAERLRLFLEQALLNPLRRAGYPFGASAYDKDQYLRNLHTTIDEHLRPPEPSIPRWLRGTGSAAQD